MSKEIVSLRKKSELKRGRSYSDGFSLIELIVVVAILAILSTIAAPAYEGYQAKARRNAGLDLLSGFYIAASASRAELGYYSGGFVDMGFQPVGTMIYRLRSEFNRANPALSDPTCFNTRHDQPCNCSGACPNFRTWVEPLPLGIEGVRLGAKDLIAGGPCPAVSLTDTSFNVKVGSVISLRAAQMDVLNMNEFKQITVCYDGTK